MIQGFFKKLIKAFFIGSGLVVAFVLVAVAVSASRGSHSAPASTTASVSPTATIATVSSATITPTARSKAREELIIRKDAEARAIPASDLKGNLYAYQDLLRMEPNNQRYQEKAAYYQWKLRQESGYFAKAAKNIGTTVSSDREVDTYEKILAWNITKEFVTQSLKAPTTAKWGSIFSDHQDPTKCVRYLGGNRFKSRGWVDAQNSFGAVVRTQFDCTVQHQANSWTLVNLDIVE